MTRRPQGRPGFQPGQLLADRLEAYPTALRWRLWLMMFLQFFIWGAWLPLVFGYLGEGGLGFSQFQQSTVLMAFPLAALVAMFLGNQIADQRLPAQRFLAFSHAVSGMAMLSLFMVRSYPAFLTLMCVHSLFFVPTINISNSIAFNAVADRKRDFGFIRMGGSIGWMLASWPLFLVLSGDTMAVRYTFLLAGASSIVLSLYAWTLPETPVHASDQKAWTAALRSLGRPFLLVLWLVSMLDAVIHDLYFMWTAGYLQAVGVHQKWVMPVMSLAQLVEIAGMMLLGPVLMRLGWKRTLLLDLSGQVLRFVLFVGCPSPLGLAAGIVLHGLIYAFFFATVYIFVDEFMPRAVRSSAQGLFNLMSLGIGPVASRLIAPFLFAWHCTNIESGRSVDYQTLFLWPLGLAVLATVLLVVYFHPPAGHGE